MYTYLGTGGDSSQTLKGRNLERENEANVQRRDSAEWPWDPKLEDLHLIK